MGQKTKLLFMVLNAIMILCILSTNISYAENEVFAGEEVTREIIGKFEEEDKEEKKILLETGYKLEEDEQKIKNKTEEQHTSTATSKIIIAKASPAEGT